MKTSSRGTVSTFFISTAETQLDPHIHGLIIVEAFNGGKKAHASIDETYPQGWPQLAAFLNSSDNFAIFRHFGTAHCRLLLHLQAELTEIEKQLDDLDKSDSETGPTSKIDLRYRLTRNEWYEGWNPAQKNLLDTFKAKLLEYGKPISNTIELVLVAYLSYLD